MAEMAAPRVYSDAQRQAMYALWSRGVRAAEISRRCEAGLAAVERFEIPRRTVQDICSQIDAELGSKRPETLAEATDDQARADHPTPALRIMAEERDRIAAKQASGKTLSKTDLDRLRVIERGIAEIERGLRSPPALGRKPDRDLEAEQAERRERLLARIDQAESLSQSPSGPIPADHPA